MDRLQKIKLVVILACSIVIGYLFGGFGACICFFFLGDKVSEVCFGNLVACFSGFLYSWQVPLTDPAQDHLPRTRQAFFFKNVEHFRDV